jgi:hypothetical protein
MYEVYSIYAKHIPNMGYPYAPHTGHSHAKDTLGFASSHANDTLGFADRPLLTVYTAP